MESSEDRLRAFCSITIDECFVVRDLKIIDGANGPFVAMPSRKLTGHCSRCHHKNHLRANYCNNCGNKLSFDQDGALDSPQKLYADVAHPINSECREMIQNAVIEEFDAELKRCEQPGYRSRYDDDFMDAGEDVETAYVDPPHGKLQPPRQSEARPGETQPSETRPEGGGQSGGEGDDDQFGAGIF
ncbi:septation protein SpoVG family protein [Roseiconus nitratireducens]